MRLFSLKKVALTLPVTLIGMFTSGNAFGAVISINSLLTNPGFESGNQASGCPQNYVCGGSPAPGFTSFTVTSAQFIGGSDGLPGSLLTPGGTRAATSPTPVEGSGILTQTGLGTYILGNTYNFSFWVGTPLTLPSDNTTPVGQVGTIRMTFLSNGLAIGGASTDIPAPAVGQWKLFQTSFDATAAQAGQTIGIQFFIESQLPSGGSGNNRVITLDTGAPPSDVPEPGTIGLLGFGLIGFGAFASWRKRQSVS